MRLSVANMRADVGPMETRYAIPLDVPAVFKYLVGDTSTDDGINVIVPTGGGLAGAWIRLREDTRGADLTNADATITIAGNRLRELPASTLTASHTLTLGTTGAKPGDEIEIVRFDVGAFTYAIANGGPAAGTLVTLPVSAHSKCVARFNRAGSDWELRSSGLML